MTTATIGEVVDRGAGQAIAAGRERVAMLEQLLGELRAEHAAGAPERAALLDTIARAEAEARRIGAELARLKAQAKQYKREVDDWKQWYHTLPGISRLVELAKLQGEIRWRSAAIAAAEAQIGALSAAHLAAAGAVERGQQQLAAFEAGVYERPIADDPRILDVMRQLDEARATQEGLSRARPIEPAP